jgi:pimeloyl-ACP methyl ester carboxylesterase
MAEPGTTSFPAPIHATSGDLPPAVAEALAHPMAGRRGTVSAAGIPFATLEWGEAGDPPVVLIHGVTSLAGIWWRIGPGLAAAGYHVIAIDLPGHGATGTWTGRHRFADTAADLAAFIDAAGLDASELRVVGHSWGALAAAHLPAAGVRPRVLVLLDPPALPVAMMATMTVDPVERHYDDLVEATRAIRSVYPSWSEGDIVAKAEGLATFEESAVRAVLLDNGDWDGGLAALGDPRAAGVAAWLVRGEIATGGMLPDAALPAFAGIIGADHVLTIGGGPHSPQRTHPEATLVALLRALGGRQR